MKVLVVDDSKAMRMIVSRALRQIGYDTAVIVEAANGADGLSCIAAEHPDLVLSDWNMPAMDGGEFLRQLRERGDETLFGFVTSERGDDATTAAQQAGADFIVGKPFDPSSLGAAIAKGHHARCLRRQDPAARTPEPVTTMLPARPSRLRALARGR
jgi:two-component system chemotaxis response regulator CheY